MNEWKKWMNGQIDEWIILQNYIIKQIMYGPSYIKSIYNFISNSMKKFKIGKIKSDHIDKGFHYTLA